MYKRQVAALDRKQMIGRRNHVRNIGAHDHQIVMIMRPGGRNRAVFLNSSGRERQRDLSALAITLDACLLYTSWSDGVLCVF